MNSSIPKTDADLNAYVDGEIDASAIVEMEAWLASHPDDAARVKAYQQQNEDLHNLFDPVLDEPIPPAFTDVIAPRRPNTVKPVWTRIAATFVLLLTGATGGWGLHEALEGPRVPNAPNFVERAVGAHVVYASDIRHPVEVPATDEAHLETWLSKRLGSPLHAPRLSSIGYHLVGGRLLEDSGKPAAQFMYEDNTARRLTVYVRAYRGKETAFKFFAKEDVSAFYWMDAPFAYALAGEIPRQQLLKVAHVVYEDAVP